MNTTIPLHTHIHYGIKAGFEGSSHIASNVEACDKTLKVAYRTIDLIAVIKGTIDEAFKKMSFQFKETCAFFEATRFFSGMKILICPEEGGKYFLTNPKNSWQKCAERICLTVSAFLKTVRNGVKYGFFHLAIITKYTIGHLPLYSLAADGLIILSNVFGIWESNNKLSSLHKKKAIANKKLEKWESQPALLASLRKGDHHAIERLQEKYVAKSEKMKTKLAALHLKSRLCIDMIAKVKDTKHQEVELSVTKQQQTIKECTHKIGEINQEISQAVNLQKKYETRLDKIAAKRFEQLAHELEQKDVNSKIRRWEAVKIDINFDRIPLYLKITAAFSKIVVIGLALTLIALNLWTAPCLITLLSLGIFSDDLGLIKLFFDRHHAHVKSCQVA